MRVNTINSCESFTLTGCNNYTQPNKKNKKNMHHGLKMALGKSNIILKMMGVGTHLTLTVVYVQHVCMKLLVKQWGHGCITSCLHVFQTLK